MTTPPLRRNLDNLALSLRLASRWKKLELRVPVVRWLHQRVRRYPDLQKVLVRERDPPHLPSRQTLSLVSTVTSQALITCSLSNYNMLFPQNPRRPNRAPSRLNRARLPLLPGVAQNPALRLAPAPEEAHQSTSDPL